MDTSADYNGVSFLHYLQMGSSKGPNGFLKTMGVHRNNKWHIDVKNTKELKKRENNKQNKNKHLLLSWQACRHLNWL